MPKVLFKEYMTAFHYPCRHGGLRIRVWSSDMQLDKEQVDRIVKEAIQEVGGLEKVADRILQGLAEVEGTTAFEVVDHLGNGEVHYTEWP